MKRLLVLFLFGLQVLEANAQLPNVCIAAKTVQNVEITDDLIKFRASGPVKLCLLVDSHPKDIDWHYNFTPGGRPADVVDALADDCFFTIRPGKPTGQAEVDHKYKVHWDRTIELIRNFKEGDKLYISVYDARITVEKTLVVDVNGTGPWTSLPEHIPPHLADISKADREKIYWQMDHSKFGIRTPLPQAPMADEEFEKLQREAELKIKPIPDSK